MNRSKVSNVLKILNSIEIGNISSAAHRSLRVTPLLLVQCEMKWPAWDVKKIFYDKSIVVLSCSKKRRDIHILRGKDKKVHTII